MHFILCMADDVTDYDNSHIEVTFLRHTLTKKFLTFVLIKLTLFLLEGVVVITESNRITPIFTERNWFDPTPPAIEIHEFEVEREFLYWRHFSVRYVWSLLILCNCDITCDHILSTKIVVLVAILNNASFKWMAPIPFFRDKYSNTWIRVFLSPVGLFHTILSLCFV
jgi:hypothetical protein